MYATALPAGSFRGLGSTYIAREGMGAVHAARRRALSRVGFAGLNGGLGSGENLCTDTGWVAARAITEGAEGIFSAAAGSGATADRGWATVAATTDTVGDVWDAVCVAEARAAATGSTTGTGESITDVYARARLEMERDAAVARANEFSVMARTTTPPPPPAAGMSQQTMLLIGGGIAAVVLVALFMRK